MFRINQLVEAGTHRPPGEGKPASRKKNLWNWGCQVNVRSTGTDLGEALRTTATPCRHKCQDGPVTRTFSCTTGTTELWPGVASTITEKIPQAIQQQMCPLQQQLEKLEEQQVRTLQQQLKKQIRERPRKMERKPVILIKWCARW